MDELLEQFLIEGRELIGAAQEALRALSRRGDDRDAIDAGFRAVHTLKGSVAVFDMAPAGRVLHEAESLLERARKGNDPIAPDAVAVLVASVDRVDVWIDAIEQSGTLPPEAAEQADRLIGQLASNSVAAQTVPAERPDWLSRLAEREVALLQGADSDLVAFRYVPDAECFFRGGDPLGLIASLPDLKAFHAGTPAPVGPLDTIEPFQNLLAFEGLTGASLETVQTHFRLVGDQVSLHLLRPRIERESVATDAQTYTLRVDMRRIDSLADTVGELVVATNGLERLVMETARLDPGLATRLRGAHAAIDREVTALQRDVLAVRLVAIAPVLRRLPRIVRDLASDLGKDLSFHIEGDQIEVDKGIADSLYEPLLHLVRNAVDHGIETPAERETLGKPREGRIHLLFRRLGEQLEVILSDDGRGIDPARMRAVAIARGVLSPSQAEGLDDRASLDLVFAPGFSSADAVTAVSGRGVGMDAVRSALDRIGARIAIESVVGQGTTMRLTFSLRAITSPMLVIQAGCDRYAIPFEKVAETVIVPATAAAPLGGGEALVLRDRSLPLLHLAELLGGARGTSADLRLMVSHIGDERVAFAVDGFGEQISATVRHASGLLASIPGIAGTTVLSDGEVLIVIDPERLVA